MDLDTGTEQIVTFYADSWIDGDRAAARRMISPDAAIEWNLDAPVDDEQLLQVLEHIATGAKSVVMVSLVCADERAAVIYDCVTPYASMRFIEFLTVAEGRITSVRQLHDPMTLGVHLLGLAGQTGNRQSGPGLS